MIKITRPDLVPERLATKGTEQTNKDCADYDVAPDEYRLGRKKLNSFNRDIYAHSSVKVVLFIAHSGKCCYCEKKYPPANLHVEHFRPKNCVRQSRNQKDKYPGYYWLAYSWENLLLACHECNSIYKKTLFPLANPGVRTRSILSHHYNITLEEPLFINPALSDPREHIRFRGSSPVALTPLGRTTIREIGLHKSTIARDGRMARFKHLNMCLDVVEAHRSVPTNAKLRKAAAHAKKILTEATSPDAEYSSMAQDLLEDWQP